MTINTRYTIEHIYLVTCNDCYDVTISPSPTTRAELKQLLADHDNTYHPIAGKPKKIRGRCPECGRVFSLKSDGTMRHHSTGSGLTCRGSTQPPKSTT